MFEVLFAVVLVGVFAGYFVWRLRQLTQQVLQVDRLLRQLLGIPLEDDQDDDAEVHF